MQIHNIKTMLGELLYGGDADKVTPWEVSVYSKYVTKDDLEATPNIPHEVVNQLRASTPRIPEYIDGEKT